MLVHIRDLSVSILSQGRRSAVLNNLSLDVAYQERVAIVGASGAGKTILSKTLLRVLPPQAVVAHNAEIKLNGVPLYQEGQPLPLVPGSIATVLQDPHTSLNPSLTVETQIAEVLPKSLSKAERQERIFQILKDVYLADPERVARSYPFELSGGMAQRVMIGMMLSMSPLLFIADEPTSSLDAPVGVGIMRLMTQKIIEKQASLLLISHDINMAKNFCQRILVMCEGEFVENLSVDEIHNAKHPYTKKLLGAGGQ